jgi:hypothetical protein
MALGFMPVVRSLPVAMESIAAGSPVSFYMFPPWRREQEEHGSGAGFTNKLGDTLPPLLLSRFGRRGGREGVMVVGFGVLGEVYEDL